MNHIFVERKILMGALSEISQREPIPYQEVIHIWGYLTAAQGAMTGNQVFINQVLDEDLKKFLEDIIQKGLKTEVELLQSLLKDNGIALPPAPPSVSTESIPPGASMNDAQIAAKVSADIAAGLMACSQAAGQSVQEDIAMMFSRFHINKSQAGARLLRLSKEKGWLTSPLHVQQSAQA
jgi:hypothetical protein